MKSVPKMREEDRDKIINLSLPKYWEDMLQRRPSNKAGYINLSKENFKKMVKKAESEEDFTLMIDVLSNYLGHRNMIPHSCVDSLMERALETGNSNAVLDIIRLHSQLLYHPSTIVLEKYFIHYFA
jgi:uncharacterized protein with von Willebrand factor type A (vWA) domain